MKRIKIVVISIIMAIMISNYYYFSIYTKTPEYALLEIQDSFATKDLERFYRYVDFTKILDDVFPVFVEEVMQVEMGITSDNELAFNELADLFKPTFVKAVTDGLETRITTGAWSKINSTDSSYSYSGNIIERLGLDFLEFKQLVNIEKNSDDLGATVNIEVYHSEADEEIPIEIHMHKNDDGIWRVDGLPNIRPYINRIANVRKDKLRQYVSATDEIISRHNTNIEVVELKLRSILVAGSLGKAKTREELKKIVEKEVLLDWETRKAELMLIKPPKSLVALHTLRIKICELHIAYSKGYAAWMVDKNALTIKQAEENLRQAMILEQEEKILLNKLNHLRDFSN